MKINRYSIIFIILLISSVCCSCGRRNRNRAQSRRQNTEITRRVPKSEDIGNSHKKVGKAAMDGSEIFKRCSGAVFVILTSDGEQGFQGSGFFINSEGLAVSNYHVFKGTYQGQEQIKLLGSNQIYKVKSVIAKSEEEDYILFVVDCKDVPYLPIAKQRPEVGDKVFAIGSPRGLENTFSSGEVSQWRDRNLMQTSALIDHGSSGGALINVYGEVVGITSGTFCDGSQANLNYAWSIDVIKPHLK